MFVANNSALVGDGYGDVGGSIEEDALAGEAAFDARIVGTVDEIFLFIRDFFEKPVASFDVNMAGRTGANAAAIMVQVDVMLLGHFENREVGLHVFDGDGSDIFVFKQKPDSSHFDSC